MINELAKEIGFENVAIMETKDIPFSPEFRKYCEDNLCGNYGVNYSCPPDCGTTDEMKDELLSKTHAIVFKSLWEMDYNDKKLVKENKGNHNKMVREFIKRLPDNMQGGIMVSASGCGICDVCSIVEKKPCRFPEMKASCVSAYCVNVAKLCEKLSWTYFEDGKVGFFGMYVLDM